MTEPFEDQVVNAGKGSEVSFGPEMWDAEFWESLDPQTRERLRRLAADMAAAYPRTCPDFFARRIWGEA